MSDDWQTMDIGPFGFFCATHSVPEQIQLRFRVALIVLPYTMECTLQLPVSKT